MVELTASGDADQVESRLCEALDAHWRRSNSTSGRVGELRPWLFRAALVDGWW